MKTINNKKNVSSKIKKKISSHQSLILDKDILKAVQIQDSMRKKYNLDKNWNSVDIVRKIRKGNILKNNHGNHN